jgi:hypothetical protein
MKIPIPPQRDESLMDNGVPLKAPELPGYRFWIRMFV